MCRYIYFFWNFIPFIQYALHELASSSVIWSYTYMHTFFLHRIYVYIHFFYSFRSLSLFLFLSSRLLCAHTSCWSFLLRLLFVRQNHTIIIIIIIFRWPQMPLFWPNHRHFFSSYVLRYRIVHAYYIYIYILYMFSSNISIYNICYSYSYKYFQIFFVSLAFCCYFFCLLAQYLSPFVLSLI